MLIWYHSSKLRIKKAHKINKKTFHQRGSNQLTLVFGRIILSSKLCSHWMLDNVLIIWMQLHAKNISMLNLFCLLEGWVHRFIISLLCLLFGNSGLLTPACKPAKNVSNRWWLLGTFLLLNCLKELKINRFKWLIYVVWIEKT